MWNRVKTQTPAITLWFTEQCLSGFFILEKHRGVKPLRNDCMDLQPYSQDSFSKISRAFFASGNWWIIILFLQHTLKEKLLFVLINTLLLHIPLLALTDRQTDRITDGGTNTLTARGLEELFPVVLFCQFLVLAGNRFWFYTLTYLEYNKVVALC